MPADSILPRLLDAARRADDPAQRVVDALVDDPVFAGWAALEAGAELETPDTVRPDRGELVVYASGAHAHRMEVGLERLLGSRPRRHGPAGPADRLLILLSGDGAAPGDLDPRPPAECLALVLGGLRTEVVVRLDELGAVVRRLGEDRSVLAEVQREARASGFTPTVLHRSLRGDAGAAGRGLARAARAVAGGMGGVPRPACLLLVGELHGSGPAGVGDPAARVQAEARRSLRRAGGGVQVAAVTLGSETLPRVMALALIR